MFKVVVTGPESTGKTEICKFLSASFDATFIPEYAREYIASLNRPYNFEDVEKIARVQVNQLRQHQKEELPILFLDTYLIITKVWFREVHGLIPDWIDKRLEEAGIDLFILCYHDIDWIPDPLRENPGTRREFLYESYLEEIKQLGRPCEIIRGSGAERFNRARLAVEKHYTYYRDKP
jgi:nicotinamide riboside kinase